MTKWMANNFLLVLKSVFGFHLLETILKVKPASKAIIEGLLKIQQNYCLKRGTIDMLLKQWLKQ